MSLLLSATKWATAEAMSPHLSFSCQITSEWDEGVIKQPVAGPEGTPAVEIRLCAAHGQKVVAFAARRLGSKPILPAREPNTSAQKFKKMIMVVDQYQMMPDSVTQIYTVAGMYLYDLLLPPTESTTYRIPQPPNVQPGSGQTAITQNDFSPAILQTQTAPPVLVSVQGPL